MAGAGEGILMSMPSSLALLIVYYGPISPIKQIWRLTFAGQTRQWESIPVFLEKVATLFVLVAYLLESGFHEFSILLVDAFLEGALDVGGKFVRALNSGFHCCGCCRILSY